MWSDKPAASVSKASTISRGWRILHVSWNDFKRKICSPSVHRNKIERTEDSRTVRERFVTFTYPNGNGHQTYLIMFHGCLWHQNKPSVIWRRYCDYTWLMRIATKTSPGRRSHALNHVLSRNITISNCIFLSFLDHNWSIAVNNRSITYVPVCPSQARSDSPEASTAEPDPDTRHGTERQKIPGLIRARFRVLLACFLAESMVCPVSWHVNPGVIIVAI